MTGPARIDHLVVAAASLEQGVAWCEATLGVTPGPGGEHPLMGTHNRLLRISTPEFPRAYFEIIAINPVASGALPSRTKRWFDLDSRELQARLASTGPELVHFVASVPDVRAGVAALAQQGVDRGSVVEASRMTPHGLLSWQITLRPDGQRLFDGALPLLIEWGAAHPVASLPESGITLQSLAVAHPRAAELAQAWRAIGLQSVPLRPGPAELNATLQTPRGRIALVSRTS